MNIFRLFRKAKDLKQKVEVTFPCGFTMSEIKEAMLNFHCAKYWKVKPKFDSKKRAVILSSPGSEYVYYYVDTGKGYREDDDDDGCSISNNYEFMIQKKSPEDLIVYETQMLLYEQLPLHQKEKVIKPNRYNIVISRGNPHWYYDSDKVMGEGVNPV
jgi:hypothetical protein